MFVICTDTSDSRARDVRCKVGNGGWVPRTRATYFIVRKGGPCLSFARGGEGLLGAKGHGRGLRA